MNQTMNTVSTAVMIVVGIIMIVMGTVILFQIGNLIGPHACICCMNHEQSSSLHHNDNDLSIRPNIDSTSYGLEYAQLSDNMHEILPLLESRAL